MAQVVVADASVLIALAQIGQLSLLERLYTAVMIPPAVQREVGPSLPKLPPWIHTQTLQRPLDSRVAEAALDAGETEAISLALETPCAHRSMRSAARAFVCGRTSTKKS